MSGAVERGAASPDVPTSIDLLLFEVGERLYAADATQVLRIDRKVTGSALQALGALHQASRALVFRTGEGEGQLPVDAVLGVRRVDVSSLRRRPRAALGHPCAIGFWLDGKRPIVLIDLLKTQDSQGRN